MPALTAILETAPPDVRAVVEVGDRAVIPPAFLPGRVQVVLRNGDQGAQTLSALRADPPQGLGYAWVCGEVGMVARVRRYLITECEVNRRNILFTGYWTLGQARG